MRITVYVLIGIAHIVKGACAVIAFYLIVSSLLKRLSAVFPVLHCNNALHVSDVLSAPVKRMLPSGLSKGSADISPLIGALIFLFLGFGVFVFVEKVLLLL